MAREIKLRAWNPKLSCMYNDIDIEGLSHLRTDRMAHSRIALQMMYDFDSLVWLQFTGLLDKNGKEIYEGDQLFICSGYSSIVEFQDGMFVSVYSHPEDGEALPLYEVVGKDTVIVGNIYES